MGWHVGCNVGAGQPTDESSESQDAPDPRRRDRRLLVVFVVLGALVWFISAKRPGFARLAAWAGLAVGVLSMLSLINAADVTTAVSLGAMHLVTAIAWVVALIGRDPRTIPTREQP